MVCPSIPESTSAERAQGKDSKSEKTRMAMGACAEPRMGGWQRSFRMFRIDPGAVEQEAAGCQQQVKVGDVIEEFHE